MLIRTEQTEDGWFSAFALPDFASAWQGPFADQKSAKENALSEAEAYRALRALGVTLRGMEAN